MFPRSHGCIGTFSPGVPPYRAPPPWAPPGGPPPEGVACARASGGRRPAHPLSGRRLASARLARLALVSAFGWLLSISAGFGLDFGWILA